MRVVWCCNKYPFNIIFSYKFKNSFYIGKKKIGKNCKTYFIADIASNHDGSLSKAKDLIYLAAKAGADAAKFQNFTGKTLINDKIFKNFILK